MTDQRSVSGADATTGVAAGIIAYALWGLMPLYFRSIGHVPPLEVIAHRIMWSALLLLVILAMRGRLTALWQTLTSLRLLTPLCASALLIAVNWLLYIWAVQSGHIVAASLGYFLNPLLNVLLGYVVLRERMNPAQWLAVALATVAVVILAFGTLSTLWISLCLALSFGLYGLIRKMAPAGPMVGLTAETLLLLPAALLGLIWWQGNGTLVFEASGSATDLLLLSAGAITAIPLLLFAFASRRMQYATIGLIQYIGPTIQLMLGLFVYGERLTPSHYVALPLIWSGLLLYSWSALKQHNALAR